MEMLTMDNVVRTTFTAIRPPAMLVPYALRRVPHAAMESIRPLDSDPAPGDVVLARVEKIGKNTRLELANGRNATLHEGDTIAAVFGGRYATTQFEGYARRNGDQCDLMSMGGLCGLVASRHASVAEPSRLKILGALSNGDGATLSLRDFSLPQLPLPARQARVVVVCGSAMDTGKTHTAMSAIAGHRRLGVRVASIKLTGTAAGRDTWNMADAGATPALDFTDGGFESTFQASTDELLGLFDLLVAHATVHADHVVVEIADGLLQAETAALLTSPEFVRRVTAFVFATGDPLAAVAGVRLLADWGIRPVAISGLISMSPLAMREATAHTGVACLTAQELQAGELSRLVSAAFATRVNGSGGNGAARLDS